MKRKRILIVGCGDVGSRAARLLAPRFRVYGLIRSPVQAPQLRAAGVIPVFGDLDRRRSLARAGRLAEWVLHTAPPADTGVHDPRTTRLAAALRRRGILPQSRGCPRLAYVSTTGVYGDCAGAPVPETRPLNPRTDRARRRVAAERGLRDLARNSGWRIALLRAPGIYSESRLPLERLRAGTPALAAADDVWTNHVHAQDLARIAVAALLRARGGRAFNACDDTQLRMGDYFDLVADRFGLPRPPRIARSDAAGRISPALLSFMSESRRLGNRRIKQELRVRLLSPAVTATLAALPAAAGKG